MPSITSQWFGTRTSFDTINGVEVAESSADKIIDLKGQHHTLGELHLDLQRHSYVIRNGTLAGGNILVGPRVDARRITFQHVTLQDVTLRCLDEVETQVRFTDCNGIENCSIQAEQILANRCKMLQQVELVARKLEVEDCWALQADEPVVLPVSGEVRVTNREEQPRAKLRNLEFKGAGGRLVLQRASLRGCTISGDLGSVRIERSDFHNCRLVAKAHQWYEEETTHEADSRKSGNWAAEVSGGLTLNEVSFDTLTVDSEVIANQCEDRSSVDIQNAFVDNEWEVLRDNYSGTLLAFHLMFLLAFIAPLLSKMFMAMGAAGLSGLVTKIPFLKAEEYDTVPVWQVLLFGFKGMNSVVGWIHAGLTVALLVYNMARVWLTVTIVKLRSREEHLTMQSFRRARPAARKYEIKSLVHRFLMRPLFLLAIISACWKIWDAIQMQIPVPKG
jgi:hypothetical protein